MTFVTFSSLSVDYILLRQSRQRKLEKIWLVSDQTDINKV